jgi:hypothetical protein
MWGGVYFDFRHPSIDHKNWSFFPITPINLSDDGEILIREDVILPKIWFPSFGKFNPQNISTDWLQIYTGRNYMIPNARVGNSRSVPKIRGRS